MIDFLILLLVASYSLFLVVRMARKRRNAKISGCGCCGSCSGCTGCSASLIDKLIKEAQEKGR